MKKQLFISLLFSLFTTATLYAEKDPYLSSFNQLKVSVGALPSVASYGSLSQDLYNPSYSPYLSEVYALSMVSMPAINVSYAWQFSKLFTLNAIASYTGSYLKFYDLYTDNHSFTEREHQFSVLSTAQFNWYTNNLIELYSSAGIGITFNTNTHLKGVKGNNVFATYMAGHLTFCGISIGDDLFGFAELGVGAMGVFQGGIGYRF